jgi:hypothetical protein
MPRGDGTGPQGMGPKTGRGLGQRDAQLEETPNPAENEGFFQRLGRGLGFGRKSQGTGAGRGGGQGRGSGRGGGRGRRRNR